AAGIATIYRIVKNYRNKGIIETGLIRLNSIYYLIISFVFLVDFLTAQFGVLVLAQHRFQSADLVLESIDTFL
ncbi:MAG TPA: hypothetical protein VNX46_08165, partial [Candidatus Acidoferrum sp.]|nr:hypothetical protein [Candidatus Acidoferrum sp.]